MTASLAQPKGDRYRWVALTNTTMAVFMSSLDGSIVLISMPAIFRGIHLDPLAPSNIAFLLWMIMGYRLVQSVFVVAVGKFGDMFGRVRIYNSGFLVFTISSVLLSFDPMRGTSAAMWLIGWRLVQAFGGSMLTANSQAILTDAFPRERRGFALGINQVAGLAGMFIGLSAGGLLAAWDWRSVFWVNVPVGIVGTFWAYFMLRDNGVRHPGRMDWWGNVTFAAGLSAVLIAITFGMQPYGGHAMGWSNPWVIGGIVGGVLTLAVFVWVEVTVSDPMFELQLFKIKAFAFGNVTRFGGSLAQGGLQFMLVIWLQGIWLPLHGFSYASTPLWAGILMLPLTCGFLIAGPVSGALSDRFGARLFATAGMVVFGLSFVGLIFLPVDFSYGAFAALLAINGIGMGMYSAPNSAAIMSSVPARYRGVASGMRATFQNSGTSLSIGVFFSLMVAGLAARLPDTLTRGLVANSVPHDVAAKIGSLPPVSSLFAAMLGTNPVQYLLESYHVLAQLPAEARSVLTGHTFFPNLIAGPFHDGLVVVFSVSAVISLLAAIASALRGTGVTVDDDGELPTPVTPITNDSPQKENA